MGGLDVSWCIYGLRLRTEAGVHRYIGCTTRPLKIRLSQHLYGASSGREDSPKARWIRKNRAEIVCDILEVCPEGDIEFLNNREHFWVERTRSLFGDVHSGLPNRCLNLVDGGGSSKGWVPSEATRAKIREAHQGKFDGEDNPFWGRKHSEESLLKMSEWQKGKEFSVEHRKKISEANSGPGNAWYGVTGPSHPLYGSKMPQERKDALREMRLGEKNPFFGKTHTPENRKKMSEAAKNRPPEFFTMLAKKGSHTRFHVNRGIVKPGCPLCAQVAAI